MLLIHIINMNQGLRDLRILLSSLSLVGCSYIIIQYQINLYLQTSSSWLLITVFIQYKPCTCKVPLSMYQELRKITISPYADFLEPLKPLLWAPLKRLVLFTSEPWKPYNDIHNANRGWVGNLSAQ